MNVIIGASVSLIAVVTCAPVSHAETLSPGMKACASLQSNDERLACYDAEVARLMSPQAVEKNFGMANGALAHEEASATASEIAAKVTQVASRPHGELQVMLDNDQVWVQTQASGQFRVRPGDDVKIKAAALGSYLLLAPSGKATKVTRVK